MKYSEESKTISTHLLFPRHSNGWHKLFGGQMLEWIDEIAGIVGNRHPGAYVVTAGLHNIAFHKPAELTDIITLEAKVCNVGKSSMDIVVRSFAEKIGGPKELINTAYATMVAVDDNGKPIPVPPLAITQDIQEDHDFVCKHKEWKTSLQ